MDEFGPIEDQRDRCLECRDMLRDLARIHIEIDAPRRVVGADEPEWVLRLRKVCLHAVAITKCEVNVDGVHVITTELRAAYQQMDAVWKCLPREFRFDEDGGWWSDQANRELAAYNHPTMLGLGLPLADGGFANENPLSYLKLGVWLGRLGCGYGLALAYLARVLDTEGEIDSRLLAVIADLPY